MEFYQKYLPIGTVVNLKNGKKRLMITGFCVTSGGANEELYDYCGCVFPEGVISAQKTFLFNHSQIENIYHMGLSDEDEKKFKSKLNSFLIQYNKYK